MTEEQKSSTRILIPLVLGFLFMLIAGVSIVGINLARRGDLAEMYGYFVQWNDANISENQRIGDKVVALIEEYHRSHGTYPNSLDDLGDDPIPNPTVGPCRWVYRLRKDKKSYSLKFSVSVHDYPCSYYDSNEKKWYVDS